MNFKGKINVVAVVIVLLCGVLVQSYKHPEGGGVEAEQRLITEESKIAAIPGAESIGFSSSHKSSQAGIQRVYRTNRSYEDIRAFYLDEAKKKRDGHLPKERIIAMI